MTRLMRTRRWTLLAGALAALAACGHAAHPGAAVPTPVVVPDSFDVTMETSRGPVVMRVHRDWAPLGVERFYDLVQQKYYDEARVYRVVHGFVVQFGLSGSPSVNAIVKEQHIDDDPVHQSNLRGTVSFASAGPNTRTAQVFINLVDNRQLDTSNGGYPPIAQVLEGMSAVDQFYSAYEIRMPRGLQDSISRQGNAWLTRAFPLLDYIRTARVTRQFWHNK